jgi:glutathione S-transferase
VTATRPQLIIGNKRYSSWSLRPWLLLRHFDVAFDEVVLSLDTPSFVERVGTLSPSRRVPALKHDDLTVWDSLAICEYANEAFLDGAGWPRDQATRAIARSVAAEMHSGFTALRGECPMNVGRTMTQPLPLTAAGDRDVARVQALWRAARAAHGAGGPFLFGAFSIADAFFAPVATRLRTYALRVDADTQAYVDAIYALPAMQRWLADAARETERIENTERVGL